MMDRREQHGYALVAALAIVALAGVFAAAAAAAVTAGQAVIAADGAASRAHAAVRHGLDEACAALRRDPASTSGTLEWSIDDPSDGAWRAEWAERPASPASSWPVRSVRLDARAGAALAALTATLELRRERVAQGLVVGGDVELRAPVTVAGSGVYCSGCLRGREWLGLGGGAVPAPPDDVRGDLWPVAAAHALGGIWAGGGEVHAQSPAPYPDDTDVHTSETAVAELCAPPDPALLATLAEQALDPSGALDGATLHLDLLPTSPPSGLGIRSAAGGYVVVVPDDVVWRIVGERPPSACPVVLVAPGDAILGDEGGVASLSGALVVRGALEVGGAAAIDGALYCASLDVGARLDLRTPPDWRSTPLAGLTTPHLLTLDVP